MSLTNNPNETKNPMCPIKSASAVTLLSLLLPHLSGVLSVPRIPGRTALVLCVSLYSLAVALAVPALAQTESGLYTFNTLAGGDQSGVDGTGDSAGFSSPNGVAVDSNGNVYVADTGNSAIRKITPDGVVRTFAGLARYAGSVDGVGNAARFYRPSGVAVDNSGNVYVADTGSNTIRRITVSGFVSTIAGRAGAPAGNADGQGQAARFNQPVAVATDNAGNILVADGGNHTIRKITPDGNVSTLAGGTDSVDRFGRPIGGYLDGILSASRFNGPTGLCVDNIGNVYIADTGNHVIRKIALDGNVSTLAGMPGVRNTIDGIGAAARFNSPQGIAVDSAGIVYVADTGNHTIRRITRDGKVTSICGLPGGAGLSDGSGNLARFSRPAGISVNAAGFMFVADTGNQRIRKGWPSVIESGVLIINQPQSVSVAENGNATFAITSLGAEQISYQWRKDGADIRDATNATFSIRALRVLEWVIFEDGSEL